MNLFTFIAITSISFSLGVLTMAFLVSSSINRKADEKASLWQEYTLITPSRNPGLYHRCKRCYSQFDVKTTDDPNLELCKDCMDELKADPEDYYFKGL